MYFGDKTIAFTIWQLGAPSLLVSETEAVNEQVLQTSVQELVAWLFRWALEMERLMNDPIRQEQQRLGGQAFAVSPLTAEDRVRKRSLQTVVDEQREGAKLASQRDEKKRSWDDMSTRQQKLVAMHDAQEHRNKRREQHKKQRHKLFEA